MPYRRIPFAVGETYHIFNRSIARVPIFLNQRDYQRALEVSEYYTYSKPPLRFSHFRRLPLAQKELLRKTMALKGMAVSILGFCLMPNHFHFLLQQKETNGIPRFISNVQNSYAKYLNTKTKRTGSLFQAMFKAVRLETDEQLLHVLRYIHLNPLTSYVIKSFADLEEYPWSSYYDYTGKHQRSFVTADQVLVSFKSKNSFRTFTFDQLEYQRKLDQINHLLLDLGEA